MKDHKEIKGKLISFVINLKLQNSSKILRNGYISWFRIFRLNTIILKINLASHKSFKILNKINTLYLVRYNK